MSFQRFFLNFDIYFIGGGGPKLENATSMFFGGFFFTVFINVMHAPIKVGPTTSKFIKKYVGYEKRCECGGGKQALLASPPPHPNATCLVLHNRYDFSSTSNDDHTVQSNAMPLNTLANFR